MKSTTTAPPTRRFRIEWARNSAIKQVAIVEVDSGRRFVGRDWASWDSAYRQAVHQALRPRRG